MVRCGKSEMKKRVEVREGYPSLQAQKCCELQTQLCQIPTYTCSTEYPLKLLLCHIWDSVLLNHPYGTFSKFPEQAKEK